MVKRSKGRAQNPNRALLFRGCYAYSEDSSIAFDWQRRTFLSCNRSGRFADGSLGAGDELRQQHLPAR